MSLGGEIEAKYFMSPAYVFIKLAYKGQTWYMSKSIISGSKMADSQNLR